LEETPADERRSSDSAATRGPLAETAPATAPSPVLEFAPADPWDGRRPYDWKSKWDPEARKKMRVEGGYLVALLLLCPLVLFVLATEKLADPLRLTPNDARLLALYGGAWISGTIGGCVFTLKWYYHSIARGKWHLDRRAWRFLTPLISGALAFATATLFVARVVPIFDEALTGNLGAIVSLSFLIGYFSDNTIAALAATADRVLGTTTTLRSKGTDGDARA
jgi:hypothetical protein